METPLYGSLYNNLYTLATYYREGVILLFT